MQKKFLMLIASLTLVGAFYLVASRGAFAACECLSNADDPGYIAKCPNDGTVVYDSTGEKVPGEACAVWRSTPYVTTEGGDAPHALSEDPKCPTTGQDYGPGVRSNPKENQPCNKYTQTYFRTPFRVPTLGDLLGNVVRLFFFIAGTYAMLLLLLGGFEWVSSGGDEKKLTSARQKILNAIIGLVVMVAVLTLVIVMEQVVFGGKVCLGISCPINLSGLQIVGR